MDGNLLENVERKSCVTPQPKPGASVTMVSSSQVNSISMGSRDVLLVSSNGLENGDFRRVHEGKMAKQLNALGSKMVTIFCRPLLKPPIRKWQFAMHGLEVFRETTTFVQTARGNSS